MYEIIKWVKNFPLHAEALWDLFWYGSPWDAMVLTAMALMIIIYSVSFVLASVLYLWGIYERLIRNKIDKENTV